MAALYGRLRAAAAGERCGAGLPLGWTLVVLEAAGSLERPDSDTVAGAASSGRATAIGADAAGTISVVGLAAGVTGR
jgi:hypothetical protein